ncbi:hypothetical protein MN116_003113 [Schistosoma mekongi]|uniref:Uncharacterized protein n=1 Tax=Schistosoma mekongi TaxID=38744 RepID=A0AAE1ZH65_SCHME|nr:hypothetical protein MN116_003113 [Schistosoma mekongi]
MNKTNVSLELNTTTEVLKKTKTRKRSKANNSDIGPILDTLGDDITTTSEVQRAGDKRRNLVTGAKTVPFVDNRGDIERNFGERHFTPNVYVENRNGFRLESFKDYENSINANRNTQTVVKTNLNYKPETVDIHNNPGLHFVISMHETLQILTFTLFGLLAGASLVHTLFVQSLINPRQVKSDGSWDYNYDYGYLKLLKYYGIYARPISVTFYLSLALVGVFIFGKFDLGRPTVNCVQRCVKLQNGLMAVIFYMVSFIIHNSMNWFDYILHINSYKSEDEIKYLLSTQIDLNNSLKIWQILDACRTAFILITWISVGLGDPVYDRLTRTLNINPMKTEDATGNDI